MKSQRNPSLTQGEHTRELIHVWSLSIHDNHFPPGHEPTTFLLHVKKTNPFPQCCPIGIYSKKKKISFIREGTSFVTILLVNCVFTDRRFNHDRMLEAMANVVANMN